LVWQGGFVNLGFEIGGFIEKASRNFRIPDCFGEIQKRHRLTRQVLPSERCIFFALVPAARIMRKSRIGSGHCVTKLT